ncbi:MAG: hypothetical protein WD689_06390 [Gaiellaceae bacterium]
MPTRKQRKRRLKELRHEWEEVYVDSEGRELPPEEVEEILPARAPAKTSRTQAKTKGGRPQRQPRGVRPPSWRRVLKRAALFAPLMYIFISLIDRETSAVANLLITLQLLLIFIPFSYLMDRLTYRLWQKRQAKVST